jgi:uncharacterized protein YggE
MFRIAVAVLALALLPASAAAQQQTTTVVGIGTVRAKADAATLELRVHRRGFDQTEVRRFVNRRTAKLFARLQAAGIDQTGIESGGVQLRQVRLREGGKRRRHLRYEGTDTVTVHTTQLDLVGKAFDAAIAAKVTDFGALTWLLEDPSAARAEAVRIAARDARQRAEAAASELGMKVVGVQSFDIDGYGGGYPIAVAAPAASAGSKAPVATSVSPATTKVEARVRVVFVLEKA